MKLKLSWKVAVAMMAVCFASGLWVGRQPAVERTTAGAEPIAPSRTKAEPRRAEGFLRSGSAKRLRDEIRRASAAEMPAVLRRALLVRDPLERRLLVYEALQGMDETNWQGMWDQFRSVTGETGILYGEEWRITRFMTGVVAGQQVVEHWMTHGRGESLRETAWAWAQTDPAAALAWLERLQGEDAGVRGELLPYMMGGAAKREGVAAAARLAALPLDERTACLGHFIWNAVQAEGLAPVIEWAAAGRRALPDNEVASYGRRLVDEVTGCLINKTNSAGGGRWAGDQLAILFKADSPAPAQVARTVCRIDGIEAFEALAQLAQLARSQAEDESVSATAALLVASRPDLMARWVAENPDDPLGAVLVAQGNAKRPESQ